MEMKSAFRNASVSHCLSSFCLDDPVTEMPYVFGMQYSYLLPEIFAGLIVGRLHLDRDHGGHHGNWVPRAIIDSEDLPVDMAWDGLIYR